MSTKVTAKDFFKRDDFSSLNVVVRCAKNDYSISASANVLTEDQKINRDLLFKVARESQINDTFVCEIFLHCVSETNHIVDVLNASFCYVDQKIVVRESVINSKKVLNTYDLDASKAKRGKTQVIDAGPLVLKALHDILKKHNCKIVKIASKREKQSFEDRLNDWAKKLNELTATMSATQAIKNDTNSSTIDSLVSLLQDQIDDCKTRIDVLKNLIAKRDQKIASQK